MFSGLHPKYVDKTVSIDPPSIAAGSAANVDVTVSGLKAGMFVVAVPPSDLEAGLVPISVSVPADNTLRVRLYNPTAAAIDGAAKNWTVRIYL